MAQVPAVVVSERLLLGEDRPPAAAETGCVPLEGLDLCVAIEVGEVHEQPPAGDRDAEQALLPGGLGLGADVEDGLHHLAAFGV